MSQSQVRTLRFREVKSLNVPLAQAGIRMRHLTPEHASPSSPSPQRDFSLCGRCTALGSASLSLSWFQSQSLQSILLWPLEGKVQV